MGGWEVVRRVAVSGVQCFGQGDILISDFCLDVAAGRGEVQRWCVEDGVGISSVRGAGWQMLA